MSKITPCLWFVSEAEEAANLYVSLLPDFRIDRVLRSPADTPGPKQGDVLVVDFVLAGQSFQGLNGGSPSPPNDAISLSVSCEDQAEVDRLWDGLIADGGAAIQCGWLKDRYGFRWQIVPKILPAMIADPDPAKAKRVMEAMMEMVKLDVSVLQNAYEGR